MCENENEINETNPEEPLGQPSDGGCSTAEEPRKMKKSRRFGLPALALSSICCFLAGALLVLAFVPNAARMYLGGTTLDKLTAIDGLIKKNYIDADKLDRSAMTDAAAWGYVAGLEDPYSVYYDAESYTQLRYYNAGGSHGIGISAVYYADGGGIYVVRVTTNSPAEQAGLIEGDVITAVGGKAVGRDNFSESMESIRGDKDTFVTLTVKRGEDTFDLSVRRDDFTAESVYGRMIGDIGFITVTTFNQATLPQFKDALERVVGQGAKGIIFDLRGNSGGLLDVANDMLDCLLDEGEIGYAVYNGGRRERLGWSDKEHVDLPYVVLTNSATASSSEYFASALRDSAGAKLVGTVTYGKAVMQNTYSLGDGSALRITVARVYTRSGTDYHKKGLTPDVEASYTEEQAEKWFLLSDSEDPFISAALAQFGKE